MTGLILTTEFSKAGSKDFSNYINYIDRQETKKEKGEYDQYIHYMGESFKTTGLFTNNSDGIDAEGKRVLKEVYEKAEEKGSLMWRPIISFDNKWLIQMGIYNKETNYIDEHKLKEATRKSMNVLLEKEGLKNAVWSAALHHNTDNFHIHISIVEPIPMRRKKEFVQYQEGTKIPLLDKNGNVIKKEEYVGTFKGASIKATKSAFVNELVGSMDLTQEINRLIRENILGRKKETEIRKEVGFSNLFEDLVFSIPQDLKLNLIHYNNAAMKPFQKSIDEISAQYLEMYHKEDMEKVEKLLDEKAKQYQEAYGGKAIEYKESKLKDLRARMGNAILKEVREEKKKVEKELEPIISLEEGNALHEGGISPEEEKEALEGKIDYSEDYKKALSYIYQKKEYLNGKKLLIKEAQNNNALAFQELGNLYANGRGVKKNIEKAKEYYVKAFNQYMALEKTAMGKKKSSLQYRIGKMFYYGMGKEKDINQSIQWLEKAAKEGNQYAAYTLGKIYLGEKEDEEATAIRFFTQASNEGFAYANYQLGTLFSRGKGVEVDEEKGDAFFCAAYQGFLSMLEDPRNPPDDHLLYKVGVMTMNGTGCKQDKEKGLEFLKESAKLKNQYAAYTLALYYLQQKEQAEGEKWEEVAKELIAENSNYQYSLGNAYIHFFEDEESLEKGLGLLEASSKKDNQYAQYKLGAYYLEKGENARAEELLEAAAKKDNQYAQYKLGACYLEKGENARAEELLEAAAEKENQYAQYKLGAHYLRNGNLNRGKALLEAAAKQENSYAQFTLGVNFMNGTLPERSLGEGKRWLLKAEKNGNKKAKRFLEKLNQKNINDLFAFSKNNGNSMGMRFLKRSLNNTFSKWKNQQEYEQLQNEIHAYHNEEI